jgi:mono/diheme cytochrome c family protein
MNSKLQTQNFKLETLNKRMKKIIIISALIITGIIFFSFTQKFDLKASVERGKGIYEAQCITCHMEQGEGLEGVYPPVAKSDYLMADKKRAVQQILYGASGEMTVNKILYASDMQGFELTDTEVSDVLNYITHSFGNKGYVTTPAEVKAVRK